MYSGSGPQLPGHETVTDRESTKCILVISPLALWACDWLILPVETLLQKDSQAAVKLSRVGRSALTKALGTSDILHSLYCR